MPDESVQHEMTQTFVHMSIRQQVMLFPGPYVASFHQPLTEPVPSPSLSYIMANTTAAVVGVAVSVVLIITAPHAVLSAVDLLY